MNNREKLEQKIEDLVWMAWASGKVAAHPMSSPRKEDALHAEVWDTLNEIRTLLNEI